MIYDVYTTLVEWAKDYPFPLGLGAFIVFAAIVAAVKIGD